MNLPIIYDYSIDLVSFRRYQYSYYIVANNYYFKVWQSQGFCPFFQDPLRLKVKDALFGGQVLIQQPGSFQRGSSQAFLGSQGQVKVFDIELRIVNLKTSKARWYGYFLIRVGK